MTRTIRELANAEIVEGHGGPDVWLLRFGEGEYDTVNKTGKNTLLVKKDAIDPDTTEYTVGDVTVHIDFEGSEYTLEGPEGEVDVPPEREEHVLWSIYDDDEERLAGIFDDLYEHTVRVGLMDQFMPRFRASGEGVEKADNGWLLDGDILLKWNAENRVADLDQYHKVSGGEAVPTENEREARRIQYPSFVQDGFTATAPDGRSFDLTEVEAKFLVSAGAILDRNPAMYDDTLSESIEAASITGFTDEKSGLFHGHGLGKHTLDQLGVTDEAASRLWYNDHDHAGVWEMAVREDEFKNAPISVFKNAANDDRQMWEKIHSTKKKAPIPQSVRQDLVDRYE